MGLVPGRHQAHIRQRVSLPGDFSFDVVSLAFAHWGKVPEGRMRADAFALVFGRQSVEPKAIRCAHCPHPPVGHLLPRGEG